MKFIFITFQCVQIDISFIKKKKKKIAYGCREKRKVFIGIEAFINTIALLSRTAIQGYNVLFSKHYSQFISNINLS